MKRLYPFDVVYDRKTKTMTMDWNVKPWFKTEDVDDVVLRDLHMDGKFIIDIIVNGTTYTFDGYCIIQ